jgi:CheY-like chemotaxis protein
MESGCSQSEEISLEAMLRISEQNAAKVLALDNTSVAIRLELEQKRRGFSLLAELTSSLRQHADYENVFIPVAKRINAALNMQRTVVLEKSEDGLFSAVVLQGYSAQEKAGFAGRRFNVPPELLEPDNPILVTGADPADRFQELRELLSLPYFVASPVILQGEVFAVLITGRLVETPPYLIRLGQSDLETVQAISAFLASTLMEQRLAEADEQNKIMVDAMPMSCVFWDENGNLSDCNQATLFLFGVSSKKEFLERFPALSPEYQPNGRRSADVILETTRKAFVTGNTQCYWVHQTATGEPIPTEVTLIRVPRGDGYTLAGYIRDLRDQEAAARHAKAKDELLASVSHEIRTPLNAIQAMARVAGELKNLNENQQHHINQGLRSITLLTSAIETILDFSKLDSGQLSLESAKFSIRDLVEGMSEMARKDAEEKSLHLRVSVDSGVPDLLSGDSVRLQQVLFNLVMNAIKFTETGGVDIRVSRDGDAPGNEMPLIFEVRDTGIGISKKQMADLFKPLHSADMSYTRKHGGLGMGLAVCSGLVTLMGGKITCESRVGEGSVFKVHMSLSLPEEKTVGSEDVRKVADKEALRGMRILVAEDNKINQMIVRELLSSAGIEVTLADNGIKALEKLQEGIFDLVLMDIQMPEMDGLTATAQIRSDSRYENLPILAMTANAGAEFAAESLRAGMNDHLTKPVDVKKLYGALKKWRK